MLATKILNGIWPSQIQKRSLPKISDTTLSEPSAFEPTRQTKTTGRSLMSLHNH
jgi:hypothetical protein